MEKEIYLKGILADELLDKIEERIKSAIRISQQNNSESNKEELLSRKETAKMIKVSLPTLNKWTRRGLIQSHRIGRRVLYKIEDIQTSISKRDFGT